MMNIRDISKLFYLIIYYFEISNTKIITNLNTMNNFGKLKLFYSSFDFIKKYILFFKLKINLHNKNFISLKIYSKVIEFYIKLIYIQ